MPLVCACVCVRVCVCVCVCSAGAGKRLSLNLSRKWQSASLPPSRFSSLWQSARGAIPTASPCSNVSSGTLTPKWCRFCRRAETGTQTWNAGFETCNLDRFLLLTVAHPVAWRFGGRLSCGNDGCDTSQYPSTRADFFSMDGGNAPLISAGQSDGCGQLDDIVGLAEPRTNSVGQRISQIRRLQNRPSYSRSRDLDDSWDIAPQVHGARSQWNHFRINS